ncbi:MAG: hypothetical protein U9N79_06495 [Actinomycetota bacterium]|nr:hypothetical protein [Actinomycetota bacterium]
MVGSFECAQVALALLISDDHRGIVRLDESPVRKETPDASVAVSEGVDALEGGVLLGDPEDRASVGGYSARGYPIGHVGMNRWCC